NVNSLREERSEAARPEASPQPQRKKAPDLSELAGFSRARPAEPPPVPVPAPAEAPAEAPAAPAGRAARMGRLAALSFDDTPTAGAPAAGVQPTAALPGQPPASAGPPAEEDSAALAIPAELESYLPPDLWRRVKSPSPARGVLVNALERVRSVLYLLSTFLPRHLVQEKMRQPYPGRTKGQMHTGTLLFSDVSGFTALSEKLAALGPEGAELLTTRMNEYFVVMLDILAESDGILLKFAGDALLAFFAAREGEEPAGAAHHGAARRAAQRMLQALDDFSQVETPNGPVRLKMKIGLAAGRFLAASAGDEKRMEYIVLGQAISEVMAAEGLTTGGGQMVLNPAGAAELHTAGLRAKKLKGGYLLVERGPAARVDDFEIQADARRARGAIPWNASPQAIMTQVEVAIRQVQALAPYLAPELADRVVAHAGKRQVASQFRPTTVVFVNFTGPEALLQAWGDDGAQRITGLLTAYFSAMNEVIARYGGIISRIDPYSKGSKMLALFGAPVAHEDDPQRAVSAALAMNIELEMLNEAWQRKFARHLPAGWNQPLIQQRIGITYGRTFAGQVGSSTRREYTVMGDEVNLAARLMSAAEMGRILIGPAVQEMVGEYFLLTERPPVRLKGKSRPVPTAQVEGPLEDSLIRRARSRSPLIGRGAELGPLVSQLGQALRGHGQAVVIQGPAGIGKSHLADELLRRAEQHGFHVYPTLCYSYNAETSLACWGQLIRLIAGINSLDYAPRVQQDKLGRLLQRLGVQPEDAPQLAAICGLDRKAFEPAEAPSAPAAGLDPNDLAGLIKSSRRRGSQLGVLDQLEGSASSAASAGVQGGSLSTRERSELSLAVLHMLKGLAAQQPTVIFFEDAHWIDPDSLELLQEINRSLPGMRLLVLLARRSDDLKDAGRLGRILPLGPLAQAGARDLVAHLLVDDLARVIYEETRGNPLQVSEITRWYIRTRHIHAGELKSVLETSDFLQKMVLSSLEDRPEIQREIARAAAVIGQEFRAGEVQALLSGQVDAVTLNGHLRALVVDGLVSSTYARVDPTYAFQQTLVRDILYSSLSHEQRRTLHKRLAEYLSRPLNARRRDSAWLSASLSESQEAGAAQEAEAAAYHFEQAGDWLPAARQWQKAAAAAYQNQLFDKAGHNLAQVLENLGRLPPDPDGEHDAEVRRLRSQALIAGGDAALAQGDFLGALPLYEAAHQALPPGQRAQRGAEPPAPSFVRLVTHLALALVHQGRAGEAPAVLQEAAVHPPETQDLGLSACTAWLLRRVGQPEAQKWIEHSRSLLPLERGSWERGVQALLDLLVADWGSALVELYQQQCWGAV
ncbi:MAG: adenylate/guanylate cyclase domain-containing protein, partial [Chloroflexota bacterium]